MDPAINRLGYLQVPYMSYHYAAVCLSGNARLMQAWLPVVLVWFVSLFSSTFAVITCVYRFIHHGEYRWKNIHKKLPPWILLAILTAAFMVGNTWLLLSSRESDVNRMKRNGRLFIGVFVGSFLVMCIIIAISWDKYQKRASKSRIPGKAKHNKHNASIGTTTNEVLQPNCKLVTPISSEKHLTLDKAINQKLGSNFHQKFNQNDDLLVLRNLSDPNEEFCLNLSNPAAPVIKRKLAKRKLARFCRGNCVIPRSKMLSLEEGITFDFEC